MDGPDIKYVYVPSPPSRKSQQKWRAKKYLMCVQKYTACAFKEIKYDLSFLEFYFGN